MDLEQLFVDPSDPAPYLVYADALQSKGDPRGELIMLHHIGKQAEADAFLEAHKEALLGPLAPLAKELALEWRLGFIRAARRVVDASLVSTLLTHPPARCSRSSSCPSQATKTAFTSVRSCARSRRLARRGSAAFVVGEFAHAGPGAANNEYEYEISWTGLGDASDVWKKLPKLEHLVLQMGLGANDDRFGELDLPRLEHLEIITGGMNRSCLRSVAEAKLASLTFMDLWLGSSDYGAGGTVSDLAPLLDGAGFPELEHLGLLNEEITDEICEALAQSKIAERIRELSFAHGTMSDAGARALAKGKYPRLELISVDGNFLSEEGQRILSEICEIDAGEQRGEGDDDRYVALSE